MKPRYPAMGRLNVLLAEDNAINALVATRQLQKLGATVVHAPDGLAALALAETALEAGTPYDAMVLDVRMPGMDGLEVARRVRRSEAARSLAPARLVVLSADLLDTERRTASRAPASTRSWASRSASPTWRRRWDWARPCRPHHGVSHLPRTTRGAVSKPRRS